MNIENILDRGVATLKKNNIPNPYLDSEILLSKSISKDQKYIILNSKKTLNSTQLDNNISLSSWGLGILFF